MEFSSGKGSLKNPTKVPEDLNEKIEIATQTLERNISFINDCDNKTSVVLTVVGLLLTIVLTNEGLVKIAGIFSSCIQKLTCFSVLYLVCLVVAVLIMGFGMYNLGSVLIARTKEKAQGYDGTNSLVFFTGIRKNMDFKAYREKFYSMELEDLLDDLLAQIYINADIANKKYGNYNTGFKCTIIGFLLFAIILIIGIYLY